MAISIGSSYWTVANAELTLDRGWCGDVRIRKKQVASDELGAGLAHRTRRLPCASRVFTAQCVLHQFLLSSKHPCRTLRCNSSFAVAILPRTGCLSSSGKLNSARYRAQSSIPPGLSRGRFPPDQDEKKLIRQQLIDGLSSSVEDLHLFSWNKHSGRSRDL
jgi:hypothetical protein